MSNPLAHRQKLRKFYRIGLVVMAVVLALVWQQIQTPQETLSTQRESQREGQRTEIVVSADGREPIQPIPTEMATEIDPQKVALGEKLFQEPRLSKSQQVSCLSCHKLEVGGADTARYSTGIDGALSDLNTPTVFNVAYNFRFNWGGNYDNLAAHTSALIENPTVMGGDWATIQQVLASSRKYQQAFNTIYSDGINQQNVIDAIVSYETTLTTPDAPFDRYLQGDQSALSASEKEGYDFFKAYGCISCHQGVNVGGNMFQKFGVIGDYFADRGNVTEADLGRFNVTQSEADRHVFRVPSLRNVAVTPPYLHDGAAETLEKAIKVMVKYQLGRPIPAEHIERIAQFLETLTGEYNGVPLDRVPLWTED